MEPGDQRETHSLGQPGWQGRRAWCPSPGPRPPSCSDRAAGHQSYSTHILKPAPLALWPSAPFHPLSHPAHMQFGFTQANAATLPPLLPSAVSPTSPPCIRTPAVITQCQHYYTKLLRTHTHTHEHVRALVCSRWLGRPVLILPAASLQPAQETPPAQGNSIAL